MRFIIFYERLCDHAIRHATITADDHCAALYRWASRPHVLPRLDEDWRPLMIQQVGNQRSTMGAYEASVRLGWIDEQPPLTREQRAQMLTHQAQELQARVQDLVDECSPENSVEAEFWHRQNRT